MMDPNKSPLFAGLAGIDLPVTSIEFGQGIILRRTYCHIFSSWIARFREPSRPNDYGEPWKAVSGGTSFDISAELHIPLDFQPADWFDRLNTVWWFTALLRLAVTPHVIAPVVADSPFAEMIARKDEPRFWPIEIYHRRLIPEKPGVVEQTALEWITQHWEAGGKLMGNNRDFNMAFQALDESITDRSPSVALVTLWGALERLFSPSHQELTFRVSANIAAYLEPVGPTRLELYKSVKRLYGARSKAAHGAGDKEDADAYIETYRLLRRVLIKMIEARHAPNRDDLESLMFTQ